MNEGADRQPLSGPRAQGDAQLTAWLHPSPEKGCSTSGGDSTCVRGESPDSGSDSGRVALSEILSLCGPESSTVPGAITVC